MSIHIDLETVRDFLMTDQIPVGLNKHQRHDLRRRSRQSAVRDGILFYTDGKQQPPLGKPGLRVILDPKQQIQVTEEAHRRLAHARRELLERDLRREFYWLNMRNTIVSVISICNACLNQGKGLLKAFEPLVSIAIPPRPWSLIGYDLVKLRKTRKRNTYAFSVTDCFTKYTIIKALPDKSAATVGRELVIIYSMFGPPESVISDRGTEFKNQLNKYLEKMLGIKHRYARARHPETCGQIENTNKQIRRHLEIFAEERGDQWDEFLPLSVYARNGIVHEATRASAFEMMFGRRAYRRDPDDDGNSEVSFHENLVVDEEVYVRNKMEEMAEQFERASKCIERSQQKQQRGYLSQRKNKPLLEVGMVVRWAPKKSTAGVLHGKKLGAKYKGPFIVKSCGSRNQYVDLQSEDGIILHKNVPVREIGIEPSGIRRNEGEAEVRSSHLRPKPSKMSISTGPNGVQLSTRRIVVKRGTVALATTAPLQWTKARTTPRKRKSADDASEEFVTISKRTPKSKADVPSERSSWFGDDLSSAQDALSAKRAKWTPSVSRTDIQKPDAYITDVDADESKEFEAMQKEEYASLKLFANFFTWDRLLGGEVHEATMVAVANRSYDCCKGVLQKTHLWPHIRTELSTKKAKKNAIGALGKLRRGFFSWMEFEAWEVIYEALMPIPPAEHTEAEKKTVEGINARIVWISQSNGEPILMYCDKVAILKAWEWTPDRVIRYTHEVLRDQLGVVHGLEDTTIHVIDRKLKGMPHSERIAQLRKLMNKEDLDRRKCQIFFVNGNHWVLGSNLHSVAPNQLTLYDTEYPNLYYNMEHELASVFRVSADELYVTWPDLDRPDESGDCGIRAIAWMVEVLLNEKRPELLRHRDGLIMRRHLAKCLEAQRFTRFPSDDQPSSVQQVLSHRIKVSCVCRMPKMFNAEATIWCKAKGCKKPFHLWCFHRQGIRSGDNTILNWLCPSCRGGIKEGPGFKHPRPDLSGQKPMEVTDLEPDSAVPVGGIRKLPSITPRKATTNPASLDKNIAPPSVRIAPDVVVAPFVLQLTHADWNILKDDNLDLWLNNHHADAGTFLLRNLAAENRFEYSGLYYQDQAAHAEQPVRLDSTKTALYVLNYNYTSKGKRRGPTGSGYHWVLLVQKDGQPMILDSALTGDPKIPDGTKPLLARLLGMEPGSQKVILFPAVQQQKGPDCGLFAIAFAAAVIAGVDIETVRFISGRLRSFFRGCCKCLRLRAFPVAGTRRHCPPKVLNFEA